MAYTIKTLYFPPVAGIYYRHLSTSFYDNFVRESGGKLAFDIEDDPDLPQEDVVFEVCTKESGVFSGFYCFGHCLIKVSGVYRPHFLYFVWMGM